MKLRTLQLLILAALSGAGAMAQINCVSGPASTKLVCAFPYAAGLFNANDKTLGASGLSEAQGEAAQVASGFNAAIATQVSQLPLATASAGTVVIYHAGIPETFNNLGPILTDRAQTVGRHRFFLGFTASQFVFTDIDGIPLGKLPFSYVETAYQSSCTPSATNSCVSSYTYTTETTDFHFKIDQFTGVATYGLSNRVDVSVIVPIEYVSMGSTTYDTSGYVLDPDHNYVFGPYSKANTFTPGTASGIGDIAFNGKGELWSGEHSTVSAGMNVRVPTGDDQNYLGSGAWGFNPYLVYGYLWKVAPHAKIGYEWNTTTELNFEVTSIGSNGTLSGKKLALPGGLDYDVGADWAMLKRVTVAADLIGNQYVNSPRYQAVQITPTASTSTKQVTLNTITQQNSTYSINNLSTGLKWNPYRNLVLSGNVLFQLNNNGLRARPTPLVGISYKF